VGESALTRTNPSHRRKHTISRTRAGPSDPGHLREVFQPELLPGGSTPPPALVSDTLTAAALPELTAEA